MRQVLWYVAAPHRAALNAQSLPFGVRHAREAGGRFTACGVPALNWAMFWEIPFTVDQPSVCGKCAEHVIDEMRRDRAARRSDRLSA